MLFLLQIYKMVEDKTLFINLFNDLSFEIEELEYNTPELQMDLVNDMLNNNFGLWLEDDFQLRMLTEKIMEKQGKLEFLKSLP